MNGKGANQGAFFMIISNRAPPNTFDWSTAILALCQSSTRLTIASPAPKPLLYNLGVGDATVASTVEDYFLYQRALLNTGTLLGEEATNQLVGEDYLLTIDDDYHLENSVVEYGLGLFKETNANNTLLHHDGDQFGWLTYNLYWEQQDMSIIMMVNCAGQVCEQQSSQVISTILNQ